MKSGFAAIIGRPNVGKSTLLNALVGQKLSIVADKPQTTRNRITGVLHRKDAQVVFLDTPGIMKAQHKLGEYMNRVAQATIPEVDVVLFLVDATAPVGETDRNIASLIGQAGRPAVLVVNKIDQLPRPEWYPVMDAYRALGHEWVDVVPISARNGRNVPKLVEIIIARLPEGPAYYPEGMVTDQPERMIVSEHIREKILHLTREEVPHAVAVEVDEMTRRDNGVVFVRANIYVEREGQKGILVGAGGSMLKQVGQLARADLERLLGSRIYLELWVKVREDWRNRQGILRTLGYQDN